MLKHFSDALFEGIYSYQTWTQTGGKHNKPIYTLTYGENTIAKYDKNDYSFILGMDWEYHIDKLLEWLNCYYPGFFTHKSPESGSYERFNPTKAEAIEYIKNKNIAVI